MSVNLSLPASCTIEFKRTGLFTYKILASQVLPFSPDDVFPFFEDPRNLSKITPQWLDFRIIDSNNVEVFEGAQFDYTIRWFGVKLRWRTKIVDYEKPERFTDIQLSGPYSSWQHIHSFEKLPGGTRMHDHVTYRIPLIAMPLYKPIIRRQLEVIFCYRAVRIADCLNIE